MSDMASPGMADRWGVTRADLGVSDVAPDWAGSCPLDRVGYRAIESPIADLYVADVQTPVVGTSSDAQDLSNNLIVQLYDGYDLPGTHLEVDGGVGVVGFPAGYRNRP